MIEIPSPIAYLALDQDSRRIRRRLVTWMSCGRLGNNLRPALSHPQVVARNDAMSATTLLFHSK